MLLEGRLNKKYGQGSNISDQSDSKKTEEEFEKLKDTFIKYKAISEKKISEISEKLNKGISAADIIKDLKSTTEISKRLEVLKPQPSISFLNPI